MEGFYEQGNEPSGFIKHLELHWLLHNWRLLKKVSAKKKKKIIKS
jgi:hypothetical protein